MWDEPNVELRCQSIRLCRFHERCWFIKTAGRSSWKLKSAKECVTTHLPNELALKMDGAKASDRNSTVSLILFNYKLTSRGAWSFFYINCNEALRVISSEANSSADLGGSSKYSNVIFED